LKATGTFHVIQACLALEKYAACLSWKGAQGIAVSTI
jgi:hypothetical protein